MPLMKSKQIDKIIAAPIKITGLSVGAGASQVTVTTAISAALALAGNNGASVPFQVSSNVFEQGVVVSSPINRTDIFESTSKDKLQTALGDEIYGRLEISGVDYALKFFFLDSSGIETVFTTSDPVVVDFDFAYRFTFDKLPGDALISSSVRNISQDPKGQNAVFILEKLTVTSLNTLSQLANIPTAISKTILSVNGKEEFCLGAGPSFSVSGTNVTWNAGNAGYALETTDSVFVKYYL